MIEYWFSHAHISETTDSIPCFKTLDVDSKDEAYQACHLSLQEYLAAFFFYDFLCTMQPQATLDELGIKRPDFLALRQFNENSACNIFLWFKDKNTQAETFNDKWNHNLLLLLRDFKRVSRLMFPTDVADFSACSPALSLDGLTRLSWFLDGVQFLKLEGCNLDDSMITLLATLLTEESTIKNLDISNNNLGVEEAQAVAEFLTVNVTLIHLDLSGNTLPGEAAECIASGLKTNK